MCEATPGPESRFCKKSLADIYTEVKSYSIYKVNHIKTFIALDKNDKISKLLNETFACIVRTKIF